MLSHIRKLVRQFNQVAGEEDECGQSNDLEAIYQTLFIKLIIWFWFVVIEKEIDLISSDQFYIWSRSLSKQVFNYIATLRITLYGVAEESKFIHTLVFMYYQESIYSIIRKILKQSFRISRKSWRNLTWDDILGTLYPYYLTPLNSVVQEI